MTDARGVGVLGATGYTGAELIRLLHAHPHAKILGLSSRQFAGQRVCDALPSLADVPVELEAAAVDCKQWQQRGIEIIFSALPHAALAESAPALLDAGMRIIDLSADFRLRDPAQYPRRYGFEHPRPALLAEAVYGLTEWCGDAVAEARLVANPGCYPTAILLGVLPAVAAGWHSGAPIVINAMSGVSGAGRSPKLATHFVECGNSVAPYRIGQEHVHLGEIEQTIDRYAYAASAPPMAGSVIFNPHLVPMARGILATTAVPLASRLGLDEVRSYYHGRYHKHPFVRVLEGDALPETRHVRGSNRCDIAVRVVIDGTMLLVISAIDNLLKGAAGQAVQNFNRMIGVAETAGLAVAGWSCA